MVFADTEIINTQYRVLPIAVFDKPNPFKVNLKSILKLFHKKMCLGKK